MTPQRPETARLLATRGNLLDELKRAIRKALEDHLQQPPTISVSGNVLKTPIEKPASGVIIGRPRTLGVESPSGSEIEVWVNHMAIAPKHVEISRSSNGWVVSSLGKTPVRITIDDKPFVTLNQGDTREVPTDKFKLKIDTCAFDFEAKTGARETIGEIAFAKPKEPLADAHVEFPQLLGSVLELRYPRELPSNQIRQAVESVWETLCQRFAINAGADCTFPEFSPAACPAGHETRYAVIPMSGAEKAFELRIPVCFYEALWRKLMETGLDSAGQRLVRRIGWWRAITLGEQRLSFDRLRQLAPGSVIVLALDSASLLDPVFWEKRRLIRQTPGTGPVAKAAFQVGEIVPQTLRWQTAAAAGSLGKGEIRMETSSPNFGNIGVKVEVVLPAQKLTVEDLKNWSAGKVIEANLNEGAEVGIAINGEVLGRGKIVRVPGDGMGVQILTWYV